jgi:hypothetical protein
MTMALRFFDPLGRPLLLPLTPFLNWYSLGYGRALARLALAALLEVFFFEPFCFPLELNR